VTVAALYVLPDGPYFGLDDVDPWDEKRDARTYAGPWPVVAHPPCARWGRYWGGGPSARVPRLLGDDRQCFAAALWAVRTFGGVLEHPEASHAWRYYGLEPPPGKGWRRADNYSGWTCEVEQGHYGHRARKKTWLYAVGCVLPSLPWGSSGPKERMEDGYHSAEERRRAVRTGACQRLSRRQRLLTPLAFRDLLLQMTRSHPGASG
jgi:hypothetical protein